MKKKGLLVLMCLAMNVTLLGMAVTEHVENALSNSAYYQKSLLLLFVQTDSCQKSKDLLSVIHSEEVANILKNEVMVVVIDFPELSPQSADDITTNFALKEKFSVNTFPRGVLVDSELKVIAEFEHVIAPSGIYAAHLQKCMSTHRLLSEKVARIDSLDTKELEEALLDARFLKNGAYIDLIVQEGMKRDVSPLYALEKYAEMISRNEGESEGALALKKTIDAHAKELSLENRIQAALLDFELLKKHQGDVEAAKPLYTLLGILPPEHAYTWQVHLLLAKYFFEKGMQEKGGVHAGEAKKNAPEEFLKHIDEIADR